MCVIRFIINLFKQEEEESEPPEQPPGRQLATIIKKVKMPLWYF